MSRIPNIVNSIHDVFEDTSGFDLSEFDGDTTFFEMGLDSLVLTQTATSLKKEMGIEVTFRQLLEETPTVDSLADWLDGNLPADKFAATAPAPVASAPATTPAPSAPAPAPQVAPAPTAAPMQQVSAPAPAQVAPMMQQVPQPVQLQPMQPMAQVAGTGAQAIVQNQLQLMAAQLQMLGGQPMAMPAQVAPLQAAPAPIAQPAPSPPAQPAAASGLVAPAAASPAASASSAPAAKSNPAADSGEEEPKKAKRFATVKLNDGTLNPEQQTALDEIIRMNNAMMPNSKAYAQQHRKYMADPRTVSGFRPNMKEMTHPIVVEKSKGVALWVISMSTLLVASVPTCWGTVTISPSKRSRNKSKKTMRSVHNHLWLAKSRDSSVS